ncbi:MAG TPA: GntR family transcriptional regulator [Acidimicrobiales bacterium]|jgi:DNA-binding GntR family transcriptional regulator|nr:GntR family transcriptional regulator [Acidimicrobiales bacterium]
MRDVTYGVGTSHSKGVDAGHIKHTSLPDAVYTELRRRILNNEFIAGEHLVESRIAEEFGVSRTTLRSALRDLANESLITMTDRRGSFVARMSSTEIVDSCFARYLLEAGAACNDLHWITPEVFDELERQIERMKVSAMTQDMATIVDADTDFHSVILAASHRPRVTELWHMLDGQMGSLMRSSLEQQGIDMEDIVERHREVIDALKTGQANVIEEAIRSHYLTHEVVNPLDEE